MKKLIPILILIVSLSACKKESLSTASVESKDPSITSVSFAPVYAGSNASVKFTVNLSSDSNSVEKVSLYLAPGELRWEAMRPTTGKYTMYDHVGDYPTFEQNYFYYFVFTKKDGTKITSTQFQVY